MAKLKEDMYLIMVNPCTNKDRFFKMHQQDEENFVAEFGDVGGSCDTKIYPMKKWDALYVSKISKGYIDKSETRRNALNLKNNVSKVIHIIKDSVRDIVTKLQKASKQIVSENYDISCTLVTQEMINEAQNLIDLLGTATSLWNFNDNLIKLYTVIPRKMSNVMDHIAKSESDYPEMIEKEQEILDNMKAQVNLSGVEAPEEEEQKEIDVLKSLGLEFEKVTESEEKEIKDLLHSRTQPKYIRAWRVKNISTERAFDNYVEENEIKVIKKLFHGSKTENFWSIFNNGLELHPNASITGKMFGHGLYFAPSSEKSYGYSSRGYYNGQGESTAYMAIYKVAYGNPLIVTDYEWQFGNLTSSSFKSQYPDKNCLHAKAGSALLNDEIIIFDEKACTVEYLIECR